MVAGALLVVVGVLTQTGLLTWFGRLPGDIRIERSNGAFYLPLTSMLLVSIALSIVAQVVRRFL
jgi:hypothetical protein